MVLDVFLERGGEMDVSCFIYRGAMMDLLYIVCFCIWQAVSQSVRGAALELFYRKERATCGSQPASRAAGCGGPDGALNKTPKPPGLINHRRLD